MIEFKNVSFAYKNKQILKDFNLKIEDGQRVCLFGKSGAGKTTILRLICSLERINGGELITDKNCAVVFQEDRLLPWLSVKENAQIGGGTADEMLDALGLKEVKHQKPKALSGGMRRRVAIARALCSDFDVLILDEPFNGLDEACIDSTVSLINSRLGNRTLILVTHSREQAQKLGAKIIEI